MPDPVVVDPAPAPAPAPVVADPAPAPVPAPAVADPAPAPAPAVDPPKGYWPTDWQKRLAKDDEKELKQLGRYASPEAIWEKARALEKRLSSGELKSKLPDNAKPEEIAQWRKDNGIPEAPEKYDLTGVDISETDKPVIDEFLKTAFAANMTPEQAKAAIAWQKADTAARVSAQEQKDETERVAALDTLNAEWGSGFRRNVQMVEGFLENFPAGVRDLLKGGRLSDGTAIFNNPDVLRGFVAASLAVNPAATLVPSGGGDPMKGIEEQIKAHETYMKEHRTAYFKDEARQADYRALLEAREKMNARKAA